MNEPRKHRIPSHSLNWMCRSLLSISLLLTGCSTFSPGDSALLSRDMYELRQRLDQYIESQEATDNRVQTALSSLDETVQSRNEMVQNAIDDMENRMRAQLQELEQMRAEVESMAVSMDSLARKLSMNSGMMPGEGSGMGGSSESETTPAAQSADPSAQLYTQALNQYQTGNHEAARDTFQQALEQNPRDELKVDILYWLGETHGRLGQQDEAYEAYRQLIESYPQSPRAWVSLERMGNILMDQGALRDARAYLQQIVDVYPDYPDIERVRNTIQQIDQRLNNGGTSGGNGGGSPSVPMPGNG